MRRSELPNIHLPYDQRIQPYHRVVAGIAAEFLPTEGQSVLDVGCGVGHCLREIGRRRPGAALIGADIDATCLDLTGERVELERKILIREVEELFDVDEQFDVVVVSHCLEHLRRPVEAVHGLLGLAKPRGVLILAVPNPVMPTVILGNLWKRNWVNPGHVVAWDRSHWINFLENICGLDVLRYTQDYVPFPYSQKIRVLRPIELLLARVFPWFANSHIAVVQRL